MKYFLGLLGFGVFWMMKRENRKSRDNRYFPVQSASERVAGHPIVGAS
jgi:hypothetical protein